MAAQEGLPESTVWEMNLENQEADAVNWVAFTVAETTLSEAADRG